MPIPNGLDASVHTGLWRRGWWWVVVVVLIALLGLVLSLVLRPSLGTTTLQRGVPVSTPGETSSSSEASMISPQTVLPDVSPSLTSAIPQVPAPPLPGTAASSTAITGPSEPAPAEPDGNATIAVGDIQLNDAHFFAPKGWTLYGDEEIENSRRAVRLIQKDTDVHLQAVTLEPSAQGLGSSCASLVDFQKAQFTDVKHQLVAPIGVDAQRGSAVRCGFSGIRASDGVPNTVTFTLVSRAVDSHVLMLRTTVPEPTARESPPVAQLNAMICDASTSFGVTLPLC